MERVQPKLIRLGSLLAHGVLGCGVAGCLPTMMGTLANNTGGDITSSRPARSLRGPEPDEDCHLIHDEGTVQTGIRPDTRVEIRASDGTPVFPAQLVWPSRPLAFEAPGDADARIWFLILKDAVLPIPFSFRQDWWLHVAEIKEFDRAQPPRPADATNGSHGGLLVITLAPGSR